MIAGTPATAPINNSRLGATVSFTIERYQSLKVAYNSGMAVRTGTNFRTVSIGWQFLQFTKMWGRSPSLRSPFGPMTWSRACRPSSTRRLAAVIQQARH
jgi:hypothetical protein